MAVFSNNVPEKCPYCFFGTLKESTTTYTSTGTVYECTNCKRKYYPTYTSGHEKIDKPKFRKIVVPKKVTKKETWFERDKREKNLINLRKKRK